MGKQPDQSPWRARRGSNDPWEHAAPRRGRVVDRWWLPLGATLLVGALVLMLLYRAPDSTSVQAADAVVASSHQLHRSLGELASQPLAAPQLQALEALEALQADLGQQMQALDSSMTEDALVPPSSSALQQAWAGTQAALRQPLDVERALAAVDAQNAFAARLAQDVRHQLQQRRDSIDRWLKSLIAALAVLLLVPLYGLWRQRQQVRNSLHEFSDELGSGTWREAVHKLREDRRGLGPASAFGALASGVESVLGESDRRWQALADLSADWYWETDAMYRLHWLSGSAPRVLLEAIERHELLGRRHDQIALFRPPAQGWAHLNACMSRLEPFRDVEFQVAVDGAPVWLSISGRPRFDTQGQSIGYEGVGRDVSERKSAHQRLAASEQRWSTMTRLAADWYWQTDAEHRLLPLPLEQQRHLGERFSEHIVGRTRWAAHRDALSADQWAEHRADLDARRPFRSLQFEAQVDDDRFAWISVSGVPRFDSEQRFVGYHGVGRDISTRKEAERLLLRHNQGLKRAVDERTGELQQLNLDLDAFARQLAHELRTPIGQMQGLAAMLDDRAGERLSAEDRELLALQQQAAQRMHDTLEALSALAHAGLQPLPRENLDLSALAQQVLDELPNTPRRHPLRCEVQPGMRLDANPAAMKIVLANLLGNAAKFTRDCLDPLVRVSGHDATTGLLCVRVKDNGAGFDPQRAGELFRPFSRLHGADAYAGSGIGLSIVQRIVERHGGTVAARAETRQGACFEFTLPGLLRPLSAPNASGHEAMPTLVADDGVSIPA
ncbi:MAG: PAS domain-containing sensor histidine kinase [Rubrivivax sp.]